MSLRTQSKYPGMFALLDKRSLTSCSSALSNKDEGVQLEAPENCLPKEDCVVTGCDGNAVHDTAAP